MEYEYEEGMVLPPSSEEVANTFIGTFPVQKTEIANTVKVYVVNASSNVVENSIVVDTMNSIAPSGYFFVEPEYVTEELSEDMQAVNEIIQSVDPSYTPEKTMHEYPVKLYYTKWSPDRKFYED